jgi:hypothetical protein
MAITFLEQKKKQQQLLPILVLMIIITGFVIWWGFLREEEQVILEDIIPEIFQRVNIDFQFLQNFVLEDLEFFEETPVFEEQIGRENPFIPVIKE